MEPARSTGNFNRRITVADSNNIITVLDMNATNAKYQIFDQDYLVEFQAVLEDLKVTVGLLSLLEAPWPDTNALMSESATMAEIAKIRTQGQKISLGLYVASGNGPWQYESEVTLQNQGGSETHVPILVPFLSSNETLLIAGNFKLGVKIEPKWNQPLKVNDYLIVKGTWRQIVSFSKKKDDDVEMLSARIASLELAVNERLINLPAGTLLGRDTSTGVVEQILQSRFATPAMLDQAITNLVGGAPNALNTLIELAASLNNDANFASTVINALATKAPLSSPALFGKIQFGFNTANFTNAQTTAGIGTSGEDAVFALHCSGSGLGIFAFDISANRFVIGVNAGKPIDFCTNVGGVPNSDNLLNATATMRIVGNNIIMYGLPVSASGLTAGTLWRNGTVLNVA